MPVEIREISIHFNLVNQENEEMFSPAGGRKAGDIPAASGADLPRKLIDACVETVLQVLKDKEEC